MPCGFDPQLVMLFAFLLLPHVSLLCPAKPLHSLRLRFTRYPPLRSGHWVPLRLHSFQSLVSPPAAHNFARLLVASGCVRHWRISTHKLSLMRQYLPCVPIVWHKLRSLRGPCLICHTCNIGRPRIRTSCSRASTLGSTRGRLAAQCPQTVSFRSAHRAGCTSLHSTICSHSPCAAQGCFTSNTQSRQK